jgi:soluble lytic murein transglycosylase
MMFRSWGKVFRDRFFPDSMIKEPVVSQRPAVSFLLVLLLAPAILFPQTAQKKKGATAATHKTAKLNHLSRAFVASTDLKPMAQQLLENRTPQAYAAVEAYARNHSQDKTAGPNAEAGALAWLVLGYARYLDKDYENARSAWQQTSALQPFVGDYLDLLRADAFQGEAKPEGVISTLEGFEQRYPDSLNLHDAQMLYAGALLASGEPQRAVAYLEKRRQPYYADLELSLARAYEAAGQKDRAAEIFRRLYFDSPLTPEADASAQELKNLGEAAPAGSFDQRRIRAETLLKNKRYQDAVNELSPLVEQATPRKAD